MTVQNRRLTDEECEALYLEYRTPAHIINHCKAVSKVAVRIARELNKNGYNFDVDLIKSSANIHDVVRLREDHGGEAAKILEGRGFKAEADLVRVHMTHDFNRFEDVTELDILCLADRLVNEDEYAGLDKRMELLLERRGDTPECRRRFTIAKQHTEVFMHEIEKVIGRTVSSMFE